MFYRSVLFAFILFTGIQSAFSQTPDKPKMTADELRKEAVEFLRETSGEVGTLRSLENRISFSSELAGLMWFYDAKQAATMYQAVIADFKQLLTDYDSQMNALGITPTESEYRMSIFSGNQDDKTRLAQKFYKAMGVRQQIAMSIAEHDATLAFSFFYDTLNLITNADFRKQIEERDSYFETQLMRQIALTNAAKAVEFGRKSMAKGITWVHADLLQKIYDKDAAKGAEFADEIVKKYKDDKTSASNFYTVSSFLNMGAANAEKIKKETGKKPMFSEQNMRDLAEILAQSLLQLKEAQEFSPESYLPNIEKYAPARAVQIRAKFADKIKKTQPVAVNGTTVGVGTGSGDGETITVKNSPVPPKVAAENQAKKEQAEMMQNVQKLGSKELPKEEREKIVAEARKIFGGMGNKSEKIMALSLLASQVAKFGDKELAGEIMKDAQGLVNSAPKNYQDFLETWFLASAYSETDADKSFALLEDAIFRLNETLAAFIKVGEFIDVSGEMIDDGEVQLGALGGSFVSGFTRELGVATPTLRNLAAADFAKTKALTNKFDRTEVRIMAKMLVLRAVLGQNSDAKNTNAEVRTEEF